VQQPRKEKKALKQAFQNRDPEAARLLLAHSMALGHERLAIRRYFAAKYFGADQLDPYRPFCSAAARRLKPQALLTSAYTVARELHVAAADVHDAVSDLMLAEHPLILPYDGTHPVLKSIPRFCGARVGLLGKIEIGADPWFGSDAVIRADGHIVRIGDRFRIGDRSTVHIAHETWPVLVGDRVTVGHDAVVHGCTVGNDCVIEDGVIILDGAVIEDSAVVEAGSTVFPRAVLKAGWLHAGSPAVPVREIGSDELERRASAVADSIFAAIFDRRTDTVAQHAVALGDDFVAATARLTGSIALGKRSSVFFSCRLDGGNAGIRIGRDCNIQDNAVIDASEGIVIIGDRTTIGHNVQLQSCAIGEASLIGIGCHLGKGTVVDGDVLLAAGSTTEPGQHLTGGWLWAGRPARPLVRLDDARRAVIVAAIAPYRSYGAQYIKAQNARASGED
jgi:carbonic anhydrase/acetyltransferase-like protein (isoleucine patch superfamily)